MCVASISEERKEVTIWSSVTSWTMITIVVRDKQSHPDNVAIDYVIHPDRECAVDDLHADEEIAAMERDRENDAGGP